MSTYNPPVKDMSFLLNHVLDFSGEISGDPIDESTLSAVLDEAAKLASDVLAPLNETGDQKGNVLKDGEVTTAPGFKDAYGQYCEGGWNAVPFTEEYGGQGLPWGLAFPVQEMWQGANLSFGLCPLLNQGAVDAILHHGTDAQKDEYLPRMISGEWTGTMNLTEPQAGSDLGLLRSKAEPNEDESYRISGQKIYITYGEHDFTENIIHLVLARLPGAPDDVKGISLFIVPKFLNDGSRNSLQCIGLEHKLGIHASPTCTMEFDGATGYLLGAEHAGLKCMFTMMNNARLSVGLQGVAVAEHAYQHALAYAQDRVQGKDFTSNERVTIDHHADVKRMLLTMKSQIEAARALTYDAAVALDQSHKGDAAAKAKVEFLTPIVKAWCTDMAVETTSIGIQIYGGMGFIEETGAAQFYRDARILPIYEGTNGIQAADLVFRKTLRDGGEVAKAYIDSLQGRVDEEYLQSLRTAVSEIIKAGKDGDLNSAAAASTPFLRAFGIIIGAALMHDSEIAAQKIDDQDFAGEKKRTAQFYKHNILPLAHGHLHAAIEGSKFI
ncbi:MAG: acyl-CoA dehydrogenase [Pseudomonadota bacterium]